MTVPTTIDASAWLSNYLTGEDGDSDLERTTGFEPATLTLAR